MHATPEQFSSAYGGNERRSRVRHAPASVAYVKIGDVNGGVIVDLSESGMGVAPVEPLQENTAPRLRFELPRIDRTFEISAELVWEANSKTKAGLRFSSLSVDERVQIRNWINDELFAKAFPSRIPDTVVKKQLGFSQKPSNSADSVANRNPLPREVKPRVPAKVLRDILISAPVVLPQELERLFPSERKADTQPVESAGTVEVPASETKLETAAYWLNFPSEADLPPRKFAPLVDDAVLETSSFNAQSEPRAEQSTISETLTVSDSSTVKPEIIDGPASRPHEASSIAGSVSEPLPPVSKEVADVTMEDLDASASVDPVIARLPDRTAATLVTRESTQAFLEDLPVPELVVPAQKIQADISSEIPVHELHPALEGPEFAASHLELVDISKAVREPGKFSGGAVSDASIESLLAIAEADESVAAHIRKNLQFVPDNKPVTVKSAINASRAPVAASTNTQLPHVALRSPSQHGGIPQALTAGDNRYRGLVIAACFIFLSLCFGVGYSRHVQLWWASAAPRTETSTKAAAPATETTPTASSTAAPSNAPSAASIANTPANTAPAVAPADASSPAPDSKFTAPPLPSAPASAPASFFPVTAPAEGSAARMVELPEKVVFDSPKVLIRLHQFFFIPPQPGPEWSHPLDRIQVGESAVKVPPPPASDSDATIVHIRATFGKDGAVQSANSISGPVNLIPRCVEAIRKWRYQPSILDGQPIEWQGDFAIEFRPAL